jgi:hypothetical protein
MLEFKSDDGYVFYLNHLISCIILFPALFWTCWILQKKQMDKVLHVIVSAGVALGLIWLLPLLNIPWWVGTITVFAIGIGKEILDYLNPKKKLFDPLDLVADLVGNLSVSLVYLFSFAMHDPKL